MQCFRVAGIGDDLGAILQWEYIAMSYKSVLAKSVNPELLVPLALAGMFAVAAAAFAAVMLPLPAAAEAMGTFTANNSVQPGGIHPVPGQTTGGNGLVEAKFAVDF